MAPELEPMIRRGLDRISGRPEESPDQAMKEEQQRYGEIGWAVRQLYSGRKIFRHGWNGKGQFLGLQRPDAQSANTLPYVYLITAQGERVPWICSQSDLLAGDWRTLPI